MTIINVIGLDFSSIDVTNGSGNIDMGSDGVITYGAGYAGGGIGIGGQFRVNGTNGCKISIACAITATMSDGVGNILPLVNTKISDKASTFAQGTACAGLGTPVLTGEKINAVYYVGASINGSAGLPSSQPTFNTQFPAGTGIVINVTYD